MELNLWTISFEWFKT